MFLRPGIYNISELASMINIGVETLINQIDILGLEVNYIGKRRHSVVVDEDAISKLLGYLNRRGKISLTRYQYLHYQDRETIKQLQETNKQLRNALESTKSDLIICKDVSERQGYNIQALLDELKQKGEQIGELRAKSEIYPKWLEDKDSEIQRLNNFVNTLQQQISEYQAKNTHSGNPVSRIFGGNQQKASRFRDP